MTSKISPTGYWTFICNPAIWAIDDFLATNIEYDEYTVTIHQANWFAPGQLGVIRVGVDKRTKQQLSGKRKLKPGIYAIVQILSTAEPRTTEGKLFWLTDYPKRGERLAVDIRYLKNLLNHPILLDDLKSKSDTYDQYLIKGYRRATVPLKEETFNYILSKAGVIDQIPGMIQLEPADTPDDIRLLGMKYHNAVPLVKEEISKRIERGSVASKIKKINNYRCLICEQLGKDPWSFRKKDGEPYIEAHHIIHVTKLTPGLLGPSNIITVCANHHRQLHYGDGELLENRDSYLLLRLDKETIRIEKVIF